MIRPEDKTENTENTENTEQTEQSVQNDEPLRAMTSPSSSATTNSANPTDTEPAQTSADDQSNTQPHQRITNIDMQSDQQGDEKPVVSSAVNLAIIFGTLIFPIIGIAMGFTYLRKPSIEAQRVGKTWLILGLIILLVQIAMIAIR